MKKLKYLFVLSIIAVLVGGVLVACNGNSTVDKELTPYEVVYCANGGDLKQKSERYIFHSDLGVHAVNPGDTTSPISQVTRTGYKFVGWAKGKATAVTDSTELHNIIPTKLPDGSKPVLTSDGGVYINNDGAITASEAATDKTARHYYYDYDPEDLWDFKNDIVTGDMVLVAVWADYNKFMIAEKDDDGEWVDHSVFADPEISIESEEYIEYNEAKKLYDVVGSSGTQVSEGNALEAFLKQRPDYSAIDFYLDSDLTKKVTFPYTVDHRVTVLYYKEIEGKYSMVDTFAEFTSALNANSNIYMREDVEMTNGRFNPANYTGNLIGNGKTVKGIEVNISNTKVDAPARNIYGGIFGDLNGAEISDITFDKIRINFTINTNPVGTTDEATALNSTCYVGVFAKSMTDTTLRNVKVTNVVCKIIRGMVEELVTNPETHMDDWIQVPNDYKVDVVWNDAGGWQGEAPDGVDTNTVGGDCEIKYTVYGENDEPPADEPEDQPATPPATDGSGDNDSDADNNDDDGNSDGDDSGNSGIDADNGDNAQ